MGSWVAATIAVVATILFGIGAFVSQGAPGSPTANISATPNPAQAQALQVTFTTQVYSLQPPNSIDLLGAKFLYSATQSGIGNPTTLVQGGSVAAGVVNSSGTLYTLAATVTLSTTAICSGSGCAATPMNITIKVQAEVATYPVAWFSPTVTIVFSNSPGYASVPALGAAPITTFYAELLGAILLGTGIDLIVVGATVDRRVLAAGVAVLAAAAVIIVVWW